MTDGKNIEEEFENLARNVQEPTQISEADAPGFLLALLTTQIEFRKQVSNFWKGRGGPAENVIQLARNYGKFADALLHLHKTDALQHLPSTNTDLRSILEQIDGESIEIQDDEVCNDRSEEDMKAEDGGAEVLNREIPRDHEYLTLWVHTAESLRESVLRTEETIENVGEFNAPVLTLSSASQGHVKDFVERASAAFECVCRKLVESRTSLNTTQQLWQSAYDAELAQRGVDTLASRKDVHDQRMQVFAVFAQQIQLQEQTVLSLQRMTNEMLRELQTGVFCRKHDVMFVLDQLTTVPQQLSNLINPEANVTVCGPTNVGKTTFMEAILGSQCLPTSHDPNTALPVRVVHCVDVENPTLVIPNSLISNARQILGAIRLAMKNLRANGLPTDLPRAEMGSTEVRDAYQLVCARLEGSADICTIFPQVTEGVGEIRNTINQMTGFVRLFCYLKACPRFVRRLMNINFGPWLHAFSRNPMGEIPTITVRCRGITDVPLVGRVSFIDTPGSTEADATKFGADLDASIHFHNVAGIATEILLRQSARVLVVTTAEQYRLRGCRELFDRVKVCVRSKAQVTVVFNKLESNQHSQMIDFKLHYSQEGIGDVHWMRAKLAHLLVWGKEALNKIGLATLRQTDEDVADEDHNDARDLMISACGVPWKTTLDSLEQIGVDIRQFVDTTINNTRQDSNVQAVILSVVAQSVAYNLPEKCKECVNAEIICLRNLIAPVHVILALSASKARQDLATQLQQLGTFIHLGANLVRETATEIVIHDCERSFFAIARDQIPLLWQQILSAVKQAASSCQMKSTKRIGTKSIEEYMFESKESADAALGHVLAMVGQIETQHTIEVLCEQNRQATFQLVLNEFRDDVTRKIDETLAPNIQHALKEEFDGVQSQLLVMRSKLDEVDHEIIRETLSMELNAISTAAGQIRMENDDPIAAQRYLRTVSLNLDNLESNCKKAVIDMQEPIVIVRDRMATVEKLLEISSIRQNVEEDFKSNFDDVQLIMQPPAQAQVIDAVKSVKYWLLWTRYTVELNEIAEQAFSEIQERYGSNFAVRTAQQGTDEIRVTCETLAAKLELVTNKLNARIGDFQPAQNIAALRLTRDKLLELGMQTKQLRTQLFDVIATLASMNN